MAGCIPFAVPPVVAAVETACPTVAFQRRAMPLSRSVDRCPLGLAADVACWFPERPANCSRYLPCQSVCAAA